MILLELSTVKDGTVSLLLAVDNLSLYSFAHTVVNPVTFEDVTDHLNKIFHELPKNQANTKPTFIMGYGEEMQSKLELHYKDKAYFLFNPILADKVAFPVAKELLKDLGTLDRP